MRRPLLLVTALLVVCGSLWWLRAGREAPEGRGGEAYAAMLRECSPEEQPQSKEEALAVRSCVWTAVRTAYGEGGITDMADVLTVVTDEDPWLRTSCHPAAHMLTEEQDFGRDELFALLEDVGGSTACDWALGHAAISGLGLLGPEVSSPEEIVAWCVANDADDVVYRNCVDGLGHYIWLATSSVDQSVAACESAPADARLSCGGGVLMQLFEPATQGEAEYARSEAAEVIPGFCAEWRSLAREARTVEACAHGAGYVFGLDLRDAVFAELRAAAGRGPLSAEARERVLASVRAVEGNCGLLGEDVAPVCSNMLARSVPPDVARVDGGFSVELCAAFVEEHVQGVCRERLPVS